MASAGGTVEGSGPPAIPFIDRCPLREESVDDIQMAVAGGTVEGSPPRIVLSIHVCSFPQQLDDACNVPIPTRIVQRKSKAWPEPQELRAHVAVVYPPPANTTPLEHWGYHLLQ